MIQNLITWFKVAARARGYPTTLYEYPELASEPSKASQLIQLNEQAKTNPDLALPAGFVLSKEIEQVKSYKVPDSARKMLGQPKTMALELLDEILNNSLGVRLFEP